MFFASQTFRIVILVVILLLLKSVISLAIILYTTYVTRQEVNQTFIAICKSVIDFINILNPFHATSLFRYPPENEDVTRVAWDKVKVLVPICRLS